MYDIVRFRKLDQALDGYAGAVMVNTVLMSVSLWWLITGKGWWTAAWVVAWLASSALTSYMRRALVDTVISPTSRL